MRISDSDRPSMLYAENLLLDFDNMLTHHYVGPTSYSISKTRFFMQLVGEISLNYNVCSVELKIDITGLIYLDLSYGIVLWYHKTLWLFFLN